MHLLCGRHRIHLARPVVMGVLNVTPDSFSDGGLYFDPDAALDRAMKTISIFTFILSLLISAFWVSPAQAQTKYSLATSPIGGAWYSMASAIAELFNKKIPNVVFTIDGTGGASVNPKKLASNQADMSLQTLDMVFAAREGTPPYKEKLDLSDIRSIILQHSSPGHWVVMKQSPVKTIADLKGKRVAIGDRGAAGNTRAFWYFETYGLKKEDVRVRADRAHQLRHRAGRSASLDDRAGRHQSTPLPRRRAGVGRVRSASSAPGQVTPLDARRSCDRQ